MRILILVILGCLLAVGRQADCNATHYEFFSKYSLGKQDEANRTFDAIKTLFQLPDVNYKNGGGNSYVLKNIQHELQYVDSKQTAVIVGKDTIIVRGGLLDVYVNFDWSKDDLTKGSATARIVSEEIMFEKQLVLNQGYLQFKLELAYNITFHIDNFVLLRVSPATTSEADKTALLAALNEAKDGFVPLKGVLGTMISPHFLKYLELNINNEHYALDDHFDYVYENPWTKDNITLSFNLHPTGYDLEP